MSRTESSMVDLGTPAPAFELVDVVSGRALSRDDVFSQGLETADMDAGKRGLLVMFLCPHCPYVKHLEAEIGRIWSDYGLKNAQNGVAMAAIMSNDVAQFPEDGPEAMRDQAARNGWGVPYLLDETQEVARAYDAQCTPDFFLFNAEMELVYRGQMDDSRPRRSDGFGNDILVTGKDLRAALDAVVAGATPDSNQKSSIGCNIKWRNVPA